MPGTSDSADERSCSSPFYQTLWSNQDRAFIGTSVDEGPDLALAELAEPGMYFDALPLAAVNRRGNNRASRQRCIWYQVPSRSPLAQSSLSTKPTVLSTKPTVL